VVRRPKYKNCVSEEISDATLDGMAAVEPDDDDVATTVAVTPTAETVGIGMDVDVGADATTDAVAATGTIAVSGDDVGETAPLTSVAATLYVYRPGASPSSK
jgi:hypothetical protein